MKKGYRGMFLAGCLGAALWAVLAAWPAMLYKPQGLTVPLAALYDRIATKITGEGGAK